MERLVPSSGGYGALGSMEGNADGGLQVDSPEGNPPAHLPQGRPELQSASRGGAELVSGQPSGLGRSLGSILPEKMNFIFLLPIHRGQAGHCHVPGEQAYSTDTLLSFPFYLLSCYWQVQSEPERSGFPFISFHFMTLFLSHSLWFPLYLPCKLA